MSSRDSLPPTPIPVPIPAAIPAAGGAGGAADGAELWNGFRLLGTLGRGNTSQVFLAQRLNREAGQGAAGQGAAGQGLSGQGLAGQAAEPGPGEASTVALKRPLPETLADREAAERFANEVRLSLQFRHPQLVGGLEGTPFGPRAFLTMPLYAGGPLDQRLQAGRLPLPLGLRVLADLASGLRELHHKGAVHQDVKTQNVYLSNRRGDRAALGDFGSTFFEAQGGKASGSPFFMAPEIYQGEVGTAASDVYSFGVLAYEVLSGRRPHTGDSYEQLMVSHLTRFVPPLSNPALGVPELPRPLTRLLELALAKHPEARPSAQALQHALLLALGEKPPATEEELRSPALPSARSSGRHGPVSPLSPPPTGQPTVPQTGPQTGPPAPAAPGKPRWNPFRRRK